MADAARHPARKPRRLAPGPALLPIALLASILVAGCGGSSEDLSAKPAAAILATSANAARNASGVRVLSRLSAGGLPVITELQLAGRQGGHARLSFGRVSSEAIRIANTIYLKASPLQAQRLTSTTGTHISAGSWLKAPAANPQMARYTALTQPAGELTLLLSNPTISLTKGPISTINGRKAIELKTKGKLYTGAIYIAATGTPYPLKIVKHGQETGQVTFSGWNDPVTLHAPANAVQIDQLEHAKSG